MLQLESESEDGGVLDPTVATCLQLVRSVRKCVFSLWTQSRFNINDPIVLVTRLSAIPALRQAFLSLKTISELSVLLDEDTAQRVKPETLKLYFADGDRLAKRKNDETFSSDVHKIYLQTLECIAALLGRPAQPRLPLLEDARDSAPKDRPLTVAAAQAFDTVFKDAFRQGMSELAFEKFLKVTSPALQNYLQIRVLFQRHVGDRGVVLANGFVNACQDVINAYGEGQLWEWLHKHHVLNDLSIAQFPRSHVRADPPEHALVVPAECVASLLHPAYYTYAFDIIAWRDVAKSIFDELFRMMPQALNVLIREVRIQFIFNFASPFTFSFPPSPFSPLSSPSLRSAPPHHLQIGRLLDDQSFDEYFPVLKFCLLCLPEKTQELLRLLFVRDDEEDEIDYFVLNRCM